MTTRWSFIAFDWSRFRSAEAALEYSCSTGDFSTLEFAGAEEILARFDTRADAAVISNTLVAELFGEGEAVIFESGLLERIRSIRKRQNGEALADILSELLSAEPNIEPWFRADEGLVGILTEAQTRSLSTAIEALKPDTSPSKRRGVGAFSRIFAASDDPVDKLGELADLVARVVSNNQGLGVILEG